MRLKKIEQRGPYFVIRCTRTNAYLVEPLYNYCKIRTFATREAALAFILGVPR